MPKMEEAEVLEQEVEKMLQCDKHTKVDEATKLLN